MCCKLFAIWGCSTALAGLRICLTASVHHLSYVSPYVSDMTRYDFPERSFVTHHVAKVLL